MKQEDQTIKLGGKKLTLVFTTQALQAVKNKYGGLNELAKAMDADESTGEATVWLTALLANQGIEIENILHGGKAEHLTEEGVLRTLLAKSGINLSDAEKVDAGRAAILCAPGLMIKLKNKAMAAVTSGMVRQLEDADDEEDEVLSEIKNAEGAAGS